MLKAGAWVDIHTEESLTNAEDQLSPGDNDHDRALLISAPTPTVQGNSSVSHR
jgi:hypothetical protein